MKKNKDVKLINVPYKATFRVRKADGSLGKNRYTIIYKDKHFNKVDVMRNDIVTLDTRDGISGNKKVHIVRPRKHKKGSFSR